MHLRRSALRRLLVAGVMVATGSIALTPAATAVPTASAAAGSVPASGTPSEQWWPAAPIPAPSLRAEEVTTSSTAAQAFVPITPYRLLDTRTVPFGAVRSGLDRPLLMRGTQAVPMSAVAVALNVTVTQPTGDGWLAVWPSGAGRPRTSNLNFVAGETVPNLVTIGIGPDGAVMFGGEVSPTKQVGGPEVPGSVEVIVDVVGWYVAGFNPITPQRVMDTRASLNGIRLAPHEQRDLSLVGVPGLPDAIGSVGLNVTVTNPTETGFVTVWPTGRPLPPTSNVNFQAGETAANAVIAGVGEYGKISIYNESGTSDVIVDVTGWFSQGFDALTPFRVLDTRQPGQVRLAPNEERTIKVTGRDGVPADETGGVSLNVTVVQPDADGYLTVWPAGRARPTTSSLNFLAGQTIPNAVVTGVSKSGDITLFNPSANVDVLIDVTGWFAKSDVTAPEIVSWSISPTTIDTSAGPQTITFTAHLRDDLAGFDPMTTPPAWLNLSSPSRRQVVAPNFTWTLVSGDALDGVIQNTITVPRGAEAGTWTLSHIDSVDRVGNRFQQFPENRPDLAVTFDQIGAGDADPPRILSASLATSVVDTSGGSATIRVESHVTDTPGGTGLSYADLIFCNPSGQRTFARLHSTDRTSGDAFDGRYATDMIVPRYSAPGSWQLCMAVAQDLAGNVYGVPDDPAGTKLGGVGFTQLGAGDVTPPVPVSITVTPTTVATASSAAHIEIRVRVTSGDAGNDPGSMSVSFTSPSGQMQWAMAEYPHLVSGTETDGVYLLALDLPLYSDSGTWSLNSIGLRDWVQNEHSYNAAELQAMGVTASVVNN